MAGVASAFKVISTEDHAQENGTDDRRWSRRIGCWCCSWN
jgi:hypothetical protein